MVVAPGGGVARRLMQRARTRSLSQTAADGPWLFLAPHPDDETLGVGALIAGLCRAAGQVHVAYLTDGSASHRDAPGWSGSRIAGLRKREAATALFRLGLFSQPTWLDWPDASPFASGSAEFEAARHRLVTLCRRIGVRRIAVTWGGEAHCDHQAAADLAAAVATDLRCPLYSYLVWGWTDPDLTARLAGLRATATFSAPGRARQRHALGAYRSQRGGRIPKGDSFRLPKPMLRLIDRSHTLLLEHRRAP